MGAVIGVIFHFVSGFISGSFYLPYKKVRGCYWESFWLKGDLFSRLFISTTLSPYLAVPSFTGIIHKTCSFVLQQHNLYKFERFRFEQSCMNFNTVNE
ncbi:MAG TPA: L-rhamnose/proton symporter RhaT [Ginsengibacter sp.]